MLANVSHEFRTPLNTIIFSNETISRYLKDLEEEDDPLRV